MIDTHRTVSQKIREASEVIIASAVFVLIGWLIVRIVLLVL